VGITDGAYSLKYSYTPGDFFGQPNSKKTWYVDATANFDLGDGWGVLGHVGYQRLKNLTDKHNNALGHYLDYKLGVTKDYLGWRLGVAAVGTSKDDWYVTKHGDNAGRWGAVASVSRTW
jgi:uncharacterized protein (TIGR02001 family)